MNDGRCTLSLRPIGVIRSPFTEAAGTPIQTVFAADALGCVEMYPKYAKGCATWLVEKFKKGKLPQGGGRE